MANTETWAYDFQLDAGIEELQESLNGAGDWQWNLRDSSVYGDYLSASAGSGIRIRIHHYPQAGEYGVFIGLREKGFSALLEVEEKSPANRKDVDGEFRRLLDQVGALDVVEIDHYD